MTISNSKIVIYLPPNPADTTPQEVYGEIFNLYRACQLLQDAMSRFCGVDPQDPSVRSQLTYQDTLLEGNHSRFYPIASVPILRGQLVNLFNSGGQLQARLAKADSMTTKAHGIANEAAAAGAQFEVYYGRVCADSIVGLTLGQDYYLSTSIAGSPQATRPSVAGQIIQQIGVALSPATLQVDISSLAIQL